MHEFNFILERISDYEQLQCNAMPRSEFSGNFFVHCQVTPVRTDLRPLNLVSPTNTCLKVNHFKKKKERTYCFIYKLFIEILCILCIFEQCLKIEIFVEKISIQICFWFVKFFVQNEIIDWKSIILFSLFRGKKTDFSECKLIALNKYM